MESQNFAPQRHQITANSPIQTALEAGRKLPFILQEVFDQAITFGVALLIVTV
jgi:hypothetical protein